MSHQEQEDNEHMADPVDRASREESVQLEEARRAMQRRSQAEMPAPQADGMCVDDCGEAVEPARLAMKLGRCLTCAQERERREQQRRRTQR